MTLIEYLAHEENLPALAKKLGVSTVQVWRYAHGRRQITLKRALEIVEVTEGKVTVEELPVSPQPASIRKTRKEKDQRPSSLTPTPESV